MNDESHQPEADNCATSVLSLIRRLRDGTLTPGSLDSENRRRCVEHLTGEGYSLTEIGEILSVSERTIARDRKEIRRANALTPDPQLADEMVGYLVREADVSVSHIRRITREKSTPSSDRINGERACWTIAKDLVESLQRLGYLPTAPQQIRGELVHHLAALPSSRQMQSEVAQLENVMLQFGTEEIRTEFAELKDGVQRLALTEQLDTIRSQLSAPPEAVDQEVNTEKGPDAGTEIEIEELPHVTDDEYGADDPTTQPPGPGDAKPPPA